MSHFCLKDPWNPYEELTQIFLSHLSNSSFSIATEPSPDRSFIISFPPETWEKLFLTAPSEPYPTVPKTCYTCFHYFFFIRRKLPFLMHSSSEGEEILKTFPHFTKTSSIWLSRKAPPTMCNCSAWSIKPPDLSLWKICNRRDELSPSIPRTRTPSKVCCKTKSMGI